VAYPDQEEEAEEKDSCQHKKDAAVTIGFKESKAIYLSQPMERPPRGGLHAM